MNNTFKTLIIGAGSIGGGKKPEKYDNKNNRSIVSWGHAAYSHKRIELLGFVDPNYDYAFCGHKRFGGLAYSNFHQLYIQHVNPDIVIVASPTDTHLKVLKEVMQLSPQAVICEKPFCSNKKEAEEAVTFYEKLNIPLAINYLRRYNYDVQSVKKALNVNYFGEIYGCIFKYCRGFKRDGCHAIDLCKFLFGKYIKGVSPYPETSYNDYSNDDLTIGAFLSFEKCPYVFLCPVDGRSYDIFDMEIITGRGLINFVDHGKKLQFLEVAKEKTYGDYNALDYSPVSRNTNLERTMLKVFDNVISHIEDKESLICSGKDCIGTHHIMEDVLSHYTALEKIIAKRKNQ